MSRKKQKNRKRERDSKFLLQAISRGVGRTQKMVAALRAVGGVLIVATDRQKEELQKQYPDIRIRSTETEKRKIKGAHRDFMHGDWGGKR